MGLEGAAPGGALRRTAVGLANGQHEFWHAVRSVDGAVDNTASYWAFMRMPMRRAAGRTSQWAGTFVVVVHDLHERVHVPTQCALLLDD